ncbi:beta strand repeat-containing protein [Croceivirga thetidis]|uniref:Sodium:calcium exchanger n=1 Tax=Croceivirga thetidis TaxID=2721623 RepID=A0ABX1GX35_9FLAO|nr:Calx-beta domain-containing protein [Croceivirga thetidis]NKI33435.1 sodium:calcium exchanger [Croceivirga thetidis]
MNAFKNLLVFIVVVFCTTVSFGQATITIEVNWPRWSSENRVTFRDPSNTQIGNTICNLSTCFNGSSNNSYDNIASPETYNSVPYGTGYDIFLEDTYGDGWNGGSSYVRVYQDGILIVDSDLTGGSSGTVTFDIIASAPIISIEDASINEDTGTANFTVTHTTTNASGAFSVNYTTSDISANASLDYAATTGTLNFNGVVGDTDTISIPILNDGTIEGNETFLISFTSSTDGTVDFSDTATITINDDDALIITNGATTNTCATTFFDTGGISGSYGNNEFIEHTICPDVPGNFIQVDFTSFDVESNFDFLYVYEGTSTSGTLIGQYHNGNLPPTTIIATDASGCLTFRFDSDGSVVDPGWEANISCFTPSPAITINNVSVDESAGTVSLTATHTNLDASGPFTVNFSTSDGTANSGTDYTSTTGTLNFNGTSGDTDIITIPILTDTNLEGDETFNVLFTASSDGTINISDTATVTINSQISSDVPLALFQEFHGNVDYVVTGNTLRTSDNNTDACAVTNTSSATLVSPIPATATIRRAYLYWAHSATAFDDTVTFEGQTVNADLGYSAQSDTYFSYRSDVTSIITSIADLNGNTYDFADLTIDTTTSCASQGVLGGWSLIIIYNEDSLPASSINLYQGFQRLRNASSSFTLDSFYAIAGTGAKATFLSWEGDDTLSGTSESLSITNEASNTFVLSGDGGQTGNNAYNSTIYDDTQGTVYNASNIYGVDLDTYGISSYISPGDTQVTANVSVANDAVFFNAVLLRVESNLITGNVFEDVNYPGGSGRNLTTSSGVGIENATVELYDNSSTFVESVTTDTDGNYIFGGVIDGDYSVRVVNSTVRSTRGGGEICTTCIPVQTFRSYESSGAILDVTTEIGGADPSSEDVGTGTLSGAQTVSTLTMAGSGVVGIDFGFNFSTIVNTNNDGQGSLEQFIVNSNSLNETGLDIEANAIFDPAAGEDVSVFMIPTTGDILGRTADANFSGGIFNITISNGNPLSDISSDYTIIDGRTQTSYSGDSNSGSIGSGGTTVGVSGIALPSFELPEIEIYRNSGDVFRINASNVGIRNIAVYANNNAGIRVDGGSATISSNLLGVDASGVNGGNIDFALENLGGNVIVDGNYIATNTDSGILINGGSSNIIQNNHIFNNGDSACDDNILITSGSDITIQQNLIENASSMGIDATSGIGSLTITENTITGSGQNGGNCSGSPKQMGIELDGNSSQITNNIIHSNGGAGLAISGTGNSNLISQNSFYANGTASAALGIDLAIDGVTINDNGDADNGANGLLNFPFIEAVVFSGGNLIVRGWSPAGATVEFYFTDVNQGSAANGDNQLGLTQDYGEGQIFIASFVEGSVSDNDSSVSSYTDADGNTDSTNRFEFIIPAGSGGSVSNLVTATATVSNSTSEFSPAAVIKAATIITNRRITYRINN